MLYFKNRNYGVETVVPNAASLIKPVSDKDYLYFQAVEDGASVMLKSPSSFNVSLEISQDGTNWNSWNKTAVGVYDVFEKVTLSKRGDYVFIRATDLNVWQATDVFYMYFQLGYKKMACGGKITSMMTKDAEFDNISTYTYCFTKLFYSCASLVTPPELPATTLADFCYQLMFYGCTSLTTAPALPTTTLATGCYYAMFQGCTSLATAPSELPATTLASYCYYAMFVGCTALTTAPELPATNLTNASACYNQMFQGCTSLTTAPALPATTLANYCYYGMFGHCTSLTSGCDMQKTRTLSSYCCTQMYYGCQSLTSAWTPNVSSWDTSYFSDWLYGVADTGTLYKPSNLEDIPLSDPSGVPVGWHTETISQTVTLSASGPNAYGFSYSVGGVSYTLADGQAIQVTLTHPQGISITTTNQTDYIEVDGTFKQLGTAVALTYEDLSNGSVVSCRHVSDENLLSFTAQEAGSTIGMQHNGTNTDTTKPVVYISTDNKSTFTLWDYSTITLSNIGDTVYFYGINPNGVGRGASDYSQFTMGGKISANGDCTTLICPNGTASIPSYGFYRLFYNCTNLSTAPELPATTLADSCYYYMFYGCTSLTTAPALPATTLSYNCYNCMFYGCTSLTTAPALPATTLATACYQSMFQNCANLTTAPELPATTLENSCYVYMFRNCTSLTTTPALPATTLASSCYSYMFQNCANLTTAPELPATTLAAYCYQFMFNGCTSLTTAPALPAETLASNCYSYMFQGCMSLTTAPALPATALANYCYSTMFQGCTSLTTAPVLPATTLAIGCYSNMFQDCTSLTTAPALPATTLANYCYASMLNGCTSLTTAPELPAETLTESCYSTMFSGCSSLNYVKVGATEWNTSYTMNWLYGVAASGTLLKSHAVSIPTNNASGVPTGWNAIDYDGLLTFTANTAGSTIGMTHNGTNASSTKPVIYISTDDGQNWSPWDYTTITLTNVGDKVMMYGDNPNGISSSSSNYSSFTMTGSVSASGDCTTLVAQGGSSSINASYCFHKLFNNCTALATAPELPATTLEYSCYAYMFYGCTALTTAPALPATALAEYCYSNMFNACTALTTEPELPATTLASYCYNGMFYGCRALTTAPELPATALAEYCYTNMFRGCATLNYIKVGATSWNTNYTSNWVYSVSLTGDFYKPDGTTITSGASGIPNNWTVHNI